MGGLAATPFLGRRLYDMNMNKTQKKTREKERCLVIDTTCEGNPSRERASIWMKERSPLLLVPLFRLPIRLGLRRPEPLLVSEIRHDVLLWRFEVWFGGGGELAVHEVGHTEAFEVAWGRRPTTERVVRRDRDEESGESTDAGPEAVRAADGRQRRTVDGVWWGVKFVPNGDEDVRLASKSKGERRPT